MAPKGRSVVKEPRGAAEIAESLKNCGDLVGLAGAQIDKALSDLRVARGRLGELAEAISTRRTGAKRSGGQEPC